MSIDAITVINKMGGGGGRGGQGSEGGRESLFTLHMNTVMHTHTQRDVHYCES